MPRDYLRIVTKTNGQKALVIQVRYQLSASEMALYWWGAQTMDLVPEEHQRSPEATRYYIISQARRHHRKDIKQTIFEALRERGEDHKFVKATLTDGSQEALAEITAIFRDRFKL